MGTGTPSHLVRCEGMPRTLGDSGGTPQHHPLGRSDLPALTQGGQTSLVHTLAGCGGIPRTLQAVWWYTKGMFGLGNKHFDFVGVGDTAVDSFIELQNVDVHCNVNSVDCTMSMSWGDKIPFVNDTVVYGVGNSANATVSAARLGLKTGFIAAVGNDLNGQACINQWKQNHVDTSMVTVDKKLKTNFHYVLTYNAERTILVHQQPYSYSFPADIKTRFIYLSSLGEHAIAIHDQIANYLEKNPATKLVFQPGTFQMKMGVEKLKRIYALTDIFVCNVEEAQRILGTNKPGERATVVKDLLLGMRAHCTKAGAIICITDGPKGAYMLSSKGTAYYCPIYPDPKPPVQRTGAGDAFASTFASYIAMGANEEEALLHAPINSMWVVQAIGAQTNLLKKKELESWHKKCPADYTLKKI